MAEAILYGTAARFLGDLASIPLKEIASAWNVKKDLKKLEATLSTIRSVLEDAEQQREKNNEVKDWLEKLKRAFYEVDDLIDDFATEALRQKLRENKNNMVKEVLIQKILKSANEECGNLEMDQLQNRLRRCLDGKRYILVLDDVWNENREEWIKLKELLMGGARGSKMVVTTRSEKVALIMMGNIASAAAYHLKGLSEDDCWSLFKELAFRPEQLENPSLLKIGKEILKKCGGVPLAIRTVGSLLYLKDTEGWLIVKDKLSSGKSYFTHIEGIGNVPSSTGKLKHLRYLDLSHNKMTTLPLSICKLQNLQMLKLSNCFELRELPIDIRRLISLRHLEIDGCYELTHMPFGLGKLTSLRTLSLFVVGKDISISKSVGGIFELNGLSHLRGTLRIKGLENVRHGASGSIQELRKANLKAKQYLQVLALQWNPDVDGAADADANTAVLEDLQPHPNLKELDIKGYGGLSFPVWMMVNMVSSLPYLVQITLADCRKCQHLPWFGQLPFLEYLELTRLNSLEYIHNNRVDSSSSSHPSSSLRGNVGSSAKEWSFFPSLKSLYLHYLPLLKEWSREVVVIANDDGMEIAPAPQKVSLFSFPCLTELDINSCPSLISVPLLPSLEKLRMTYISEKLLQSMMTRVIETDSHITTTTIDYSSIPSSPLPSLKTLSICFCEDLVSLPEEGLRNLTSLQHLLIIQCHKLVHLPEEGLRGLISLQSLHINFCDSLTSISVSRGMQHLTALQKLEICNCPAFNWSDEDDGMQVLTALRSLQSLHISVLPKLVSLPHGLQHLTTLQALDILHCDGLVNLPEWIGNLASLRILHIINCQKLESLPDTMRFLTALKELEIDRCDILTERCQRERGTEWPKIAHIPKIRIECEWI